MKLPKFDVNIAETRGQREYNMTLEMMTNPLDKIKGIRSLDEMLTRGGQAISVYREQRRGRDIPTDEEFVRLMDKAKFGTAPVIAESLWQKFYQNADQHFFSSFRRPEKSMAEYKAIFGGEAADEFVTAAENIVEGRFDLFGLKNLAVGTEIDWHREPVSGKRSPLKHWKQFDDLDTRETGNKKIVWELNRHQHFFTLGFAFWLTGDECFAETFVRHLDSWMEQNPPGIGVNWSSSLEVAFRATSWIWAFHFFRNSSHFTPELFKKTLKYLYLHGQHIERYLSKYYSPNTHLTGEALGLYYLGTQLPFFTRAGHWRKLGEDILLKEITKQVRPDGVYFEQSTWYQRYTADIYSHFIVLRAISDEPYYDAPAAELENRIQSAFDFLMHITMPDGRTPIIGDDDGGRVLPLTTAEPDDFRGTLGVGAVLFERGDHKHVSGGPGEELFWLLGADGVNSYGAVKTSEPAAGSADFPDGGYCVMRDGFDDTDNYLIVDCGDVGSLSGGHGHADALSIEMAMNGQTILADSGTYTYHESRELRDYFRSTTAHNTVVVDQLSSSEPGGKFSWRFRAEAQRNAWISEGRFDLFEGSHNGYERLDDPATHTRSILFLKGDYWIMRDLITAKGEHDFSLNFHFDQTVKPTIVGDGRYVEVSDNRIFTFGDNGSWQQEESWISNNHCQRINAPFLRFSSNGEGTQEFFTFMLPAASGGDAPKVTEIPSSLGRSFVIKYAGYTDIFVYNDVAGQMIDNGIFESDHRYAWARLSKGETVPDEFVLIDGSRLRIDRKDILDGHDVSYASARRLGSELYVKTWLGRSKKSLSPAA